MDSVAYAVYLADYLSIPDMPLENRSDKWWDKFWSYMGLKKVRRIREANKDATER